MVNLATRDSPHLRIQRPCGKDADIDVVGNIISAIAGAINAVFSAIASFLMAIVSGMSQFFTVISVSLDTQYPLFCVSTDVEDRYRVRTHRYLELHHLWQMRRKERRIVLGGEI
jgi:hypothetical protein